MAIRSLRGFIIPLSYKYELQMLKEAAFGECNGSRDGYNVRSYNSISSYNVGSYTMVAYSAL